MSEINLGLLTGATPFNVAETLTAGEEKSYTFQIGRQAGLEHEAKLTFNNNNGFGDLDLYLYKQGATTPLAQSTTSDDAEWIQFDGLDSGVYTLKVSGYRGLTNQNQGVTSAFSLDIIAPDITTPPPSVNTGFNTSIALDPQKDLQIKASGNPTYYSFQMGSTGLASHYLNVQYDASRSGVQLRLFDANGADITPAQNKVDGNGNPVLDANNNPVPAILDVKDPANSQKSLGNTQISLEGLPQGQYFISVTPTNQSPNTYRFNLDAPQATPDAWTVMTYITADDLEQNAPINIEQIESLVDVAPNTVNFSVLWDQSSNAITTDPETGEERPLVKYPTPGLQPWGDVGMSFIRAGSQQTKWYLKNAALKNPEPNDPRIVSPFEGLKEKDTGTKESLKQFVQDSVADAPASKYALVMWDHGNGPFGFNFDRSDKEPGSIFSTKTFINALEELKTAPSPVNLSLLAFDECLMASVEVAYELRNYTPVLVASEEVVGGRGYDYYKAFDALKNSATDEKQLAKSIVSAFESVYSTDPQRWNTLSAIETSKLGNLILAVKDFVDEAINAKPEEWSLIVEARNKAQFVKDASLRDLGSFMQGIQEQADINGTLKAKAKAVELAIKGDTQNPGAVFAITPTSAKQGKTGLTVFLPNKDEYDAKNKTKEIAAYKANHQNFLAATGWDKFIEILKEQFPSSTDTANPTNNTTSAGDTTAKSRSISSFAGENANAPVEEPLQGFDSYYDLQSGGLSVLTVGDAFDYFAFDGTPDPNSYTFAIGATGTADDKITLYSNNPNAKFTLTLLDANNNSVGKFSGQGMINVSLQNLTAGIYTLQLIADQDVSSYSLYAKAPGFNPGLKPFVGNDQVQFGGLFDKAAVVGEGPFYTGNQLLSPSDPWYAKQDWYTFELPRTVDEDMPFGAVNVYLADPTQKATVKLYDEEGKLLGTNQGFGKIAVRYPNINDAKYYFSVSKAEDNTSSAPLGYSFVMAPINPDGLPTLSISNSANNGQNTGLLQLDGDAAFARLAVSLESKKIARFNVHELGVFGADDALGTIDGLKPGQAGYIEAALKRSKTIFSVLPDNFVQNPTRVLDGFSQTQPFLGFYLIKNGTRDEVLSNPNAQSKVLLGTTTNGQDTGIVSAAAGIADQFSVNFKDQTGATEPNFTLKVGLTDSDRPLGSGLQDNSQRELVDLRGFTGKTVQMAFPTVASEAAYNNVVGFYRLENETGGVRDPLTGQVLNPGDANYAKAALRNSQQFGVSFGKDAAGLSSNFAGGFLYAPFLIANSTIAQVLNSTTTNNPVYFAYLGANSDRADHVRLLGDNTWGFEDLPNLGDADFNDVVIKANLKVLT